MTTSCEHPLESEGDVALADRMRASRDRMLAELGKIIIGQSAVIEQVMLTLLVGGNSLIVGVPGLAKTLLIKTMADVLDLKFARIQFTPGPDAVRHHRHRHHPGRPADRQAPHGVLAGARLHERAARRRDQPDTAEDAVGAARGDAGAPGDDPGPHLRARGAVPRLRHAEPDRTRRHLPPARGAARSVHVPHRDRSPARGRRARGAADDDGGAGRHGVAGGDGRRTARVPAARAARARSPSP